MMPDSPMRGHIDAADRELCNLFREFLPALLAAHPDISEQTKLRVAMAMAQGVGQLLEGKRVADATSVCDFKFHFMPPGIRFDDRLDLEGHSGVLNISGGGCGYTRIIPLALNEREREMLAPVFKHAWQVVRNAYQCRQSRLYLSPERVAEHENELQHAIMDTLGVICDEPHQQATVRYAAHVQGTTMERTFLGLLKLAMAGETKIAR